MPDDPDRAVWRFEKGDDTGEPRVTLRYLRRQGKVRTAVELYGGTLKAADLQPRILKLKRVP